MAKDITERTDSFTTRVKTELSGLKIKRFEDARALLCAFTLGIGALKFVPQKRSWGVRYSLKSRESMELCAKLCAQYYSLEYSISEVKHERLNANNIELIVYGEGMERFMQSVGMMSVNESGEREFTPAMPEDIASSDSQMRSFVRGLFLSCGMMSDPAKNYHIEFVVNRVFLADKAAEILAGCGIAPNRSKRKNNEVLYVKEGEKLEDLLAFIGASEAMMLVSNERIIKQANNTANRYVNCTTANVNKSYAAAHKQAEDIELVLKTLGAEALGEELMALAKARCENLYLSLADLADELGMGRSAVNYRLKKLEKMAADIKGKRTDTD
jgi:hypothetical protein